MMEWSRPSLVEGHTYHHIHHELCFFLITLLLLLLGLFWLLFFLFFFLFFSFLFLLQMSASSTESIAIEDWTSRATFRCLLLFSSFLIQPSWMLDEAVECGSWMRHSLCHQLRNLVFFLVFFLFLDPLRNPPSFDIWNVVCEWKLVYSWCE